MSGIPSQEEALFADAIAQPPADRGPYLAKACGANVELLARMAGLVAAHDGPNEAERGQFAKRERGFAA